ncbi:bacteriocin immunity protein [Superficieibacter sp. HKU1]|uniref:bacteriocin immunity protein n=1 Tax=Superficieibacter sp. HKU1 TaxID=3031919 RepID=UPI0023E0ED38|nr:bacteriocin immunity protein [Superficieibacter sp. HKU1]WES69317.1 bacteriocin immunity protein [Superficieibacter sp. HKU1]
MINFKEKITDYTEEEFIELLDEFLMDTRKDKTLNGNELEDYIDRLTDHFIEITEHPSGSDLLFYPETDEDEEPKKILNTVKEWRRSQGLPLFKNSK